MKGDMYVVWQVRILISKFFGVKAGRSIWRECHISTRPHQSKAVCLEEFAYLRDTVLPATGVKIRGYVIESYLKEEEIF
jgi:hypothetical protein